MNTSRRNFLINSSFTVAGTLVFPTKIFASTKNEKLVGVQLYSIRDEMKANPLETLKELSKIGYTHVEHANYVSRKFYGYPASEFKKILDDLGLRMLSGHTVMGPQHWDSTTKNFTDEWKYTVEDAATVGQQYVVNPWLDVSLRKNYDDLLSFLDLFNKSGELCKSSNMKFGYHNHNFEFKYSLNNQKLYDIILEHTDPALVAQQLDIGNMYGGGGRAIEVIKKYPGRFELMHVKDEIKSTKGEMDDPYESTILGKGIIDVKSVIDLGLKSGGTSHFIIEQESYQGKTPLECVKEDLKIMKTWGY
jgi:sugar phosphate isomerase/epimerase